MKYTEELHWILDKPNTTLRNQEEKYQENIAFVHSLGLKCDCVGWSTLDLQDPRAEEILEKVAQFCKENNWTSRGCYTRKYTDVESDWYEIKTDFFREDSRADRIETQTADGQKITLNTIRAYHEMTAAPKCWGIHPLMPERFRDAYQKHGLSGLDFCWAKDVGKYAAEQYFYIYGKQLIPHAAVDWGLKKAGYFRIRAAGGWLPKLAKTLHKLQMIHLPKCFLAKDMPADGIAYAYIPQTFSCCGMDTILLHKDVAQLLLQEKAIPASALSPVPVVDSLPGGYILEKTSVSPRPTEQFMGQMLTEYEKIKAAPRPIRKITEKNALTVLRKAKTQQKERFQKRIPKARCDSLLETDYAPLLSYYLVTNGGYLSDEYELLAYDAAVEADREFAENLKKEELLENKPDGIVIARCADGDSILLCRDGVVIRFSHEAPEITNQWSSLAQFIFDAVTENE